MSKLLVVSTDFIEKNNDRNDNHISDVISGTSGGAINGWIIINHMY
jgi:predicted acylesterase/phospholipase RssA